jgi:hypothetical protein
MRIDDVAETASVLLRKLRFLRRFDSCGEAQELVDQKILNRRSGRAVVARIW